MIGDFFYSLFNFCFILIFLVAGFGLTICWVGIPIVIFLFKIIEKLTEKEINFTENFLPIELKRIQFNSYSGKSLLNKFKLYIKDKKVWRYIRFYVLKFPITVVTFSISLFLILIPVVLIIAPLIYNIVSYNILQFEVTSLFSALLMTILGIGLSLIFFPVLNKIALKQGCLLKNLE